MKNLCYNTMFFARLRKLLICVTCIFGLFACDSGSGGGSSSSPQITAFGILGNSGATYNGTISQPATASSYGTITVSVPAGVSLSTNLVASFTANGNVYVNSSSGGEIQQYSGASPNSFASPQYYTVTNSNGSAIYQVTVTVSSVISTPTGISFSPDGSIAYITNGVTSGTVTSCRVNGNTLYSCVNSGVNVTLNTPQDILIESITAIPTGESSAITLQAAFITSANSNAVITCIANGQQLYNCYSNSIGTPVNGIAIDNNNTALVSSVSTSNISACPITVGLNGLSTYNVLLNTTAAPCIAESTAANLVGPDNITFNSSNTTAFFVDFSSTTGGNPVTACTYTSGSTPTLTNCLATNAQGSATVVFNAPTTAVLNNAGNLMFIANSAAGSISPVVTCNYSNSSGINLLYSCFNSQAALMSRPYDLVLNTSGTTAFMVNNSNSTIVECSVNSSGYFSNCNYTGMQ